MIIKPNNPKSKLRPFPAAPREIQLAEAIENELKMREERGQKRGGDFSEPAAPPKK